MFFKIRLLSGNLIDNFLFMFILAAVVGSGIATIIYGLTTSPVEMLIGLLGTVLVCIVIFKSGLPAF